MPSRVQSQPTQKNIKPLRNRREAKRLLFRYSRFRLIFPITPPLEGESQQPSRQARLPRWGESGRGGCVSVGGGGGDDVPPTGATSGSALVLPTPPQA
ncbi:MAG: hypothetical protein OXU61_13490 [Gammaproteobacteria bacterium]|nr:hypothetical protein [Gammaproteobacteria bacterium]